MAANIAVICNFNRVSRALIQRLKAAGDTVHIISEYDIDGEICYDINKPETFPLKSVDMALNCLNWSGELVQSLHNDYWEIIDNNRPFHPFTEFASIICVNIVDYVSCLTAQDVNCQLSDILVVPSVYGAPDSMGMEYETKKGFFWDLYQQESVTLHNPDQRVQIRSLDAVLEKMMQLFGQDGTAPEMFVNNNIPKYIPGKPVCLFDIADAYGKATQKLIDVGIDPEISYRNAKSYLLGNNFINVYSDDEFNSAPV